MRTVLAGLVLASSLAVQSKERDEKVWTALRPALLAFHEGGSRAELLATCRRLRAEHPGSFYEDQLQSLIAPLARDAVRPEGAMDAAVYALRDRAAPQS